MPVNWKSKNNIKQLYKDKSENNIHTYGREQQVLEVKQYYIAILYFNNSKVRHGRHFDFCLNRCCLAVFPQSSLSPQKTG